MAEGRGDGTGQNSACYHCYFINPVRVPVTMWGRSSWMLNWEWREMSCEAQGWVLEVRFCLLWPARCMRPGKTHASLRLECGGSFPGQRRLGAARDFSPSRRAATGKRSEHRRKESRATRMIPTAVLHTCSARHTKSPCLEHDETLLFHYLLPKLLRFIKHLGTLKLCIFHIAQFYGYVPFRLRIWFQSAKITALCKISTLSTVK